ncbi:hypothetical protein [Rhodopseudomonas boonkerdii]|nr:hypothetical protein [Rhodopseudomonas boonkerdii]
MRTGQPASYVEVVIDETTGEIIPRKAGTGQAAEQGLGRIDIQDSLEA